MILIISLIKAIIVAALSYRSWNHSIGTGFNPAAASGHLLSSLSSINPANASLALSKFVGIASILTGIGLAIGTSSAYCVGSPNACGTSCLKRNPTPPMQ